MATRITGEYEKIGSINYFIPFPLPPHNPALTIDEELTQLHEAAMQQFVNAGIVVPGNEQQDKQYFRRLSQSVG